MIQPQHEPADASSALPSPGGAFVDLTVPLLPTRIDFFFSIASSSEGGTTGRIDKCTMTGRGAGGGPDVEGELDDAKSSGDRRILVIG